MFWNGSTAMDGLSGSGKRRVRRRRVARLPPRMHRRCPVGGSHSTRKARTGRSMFFRRGSPRSSNVAFSRPVDRFVHGARDHDPTRRRFRLQPRGDVHAIAVEIVAVDDQVAEVQADAEHDGGVLGLIPIGFGHRLLELDGGAKRIDGAGELDQRAVARQLDQPATMAREDRLQPLRCDGPRSRASVPFSSRPISRE